jgi:hypothetical protein
MLHWFLPYLQSNDFWIRAEQYTHFEAGLFWGILEYDLPVIQFKEMPLCVNNCGWTRIKPGWSSWWGCKIYGLYAKYFVMTRQYICHE